MAAIQENTCAACGKASTTRCAGCIEGIDQQGQLSPTYYCSKDCQRAHWSQHKAECKLANAHKVLYRGGELVQEMFYKYRERFFDLNISKVRHNPDTGTVGVYEGERVRDEILIPFPTHLFTDDRDKQAALAWSACEFGVGYLSNQVKQAIKGVVAKIEDIHIDVVDTTDRPRLIFIRTGGQPDTDYFNMPHQLLRVTLSNGERYALDITGAQYGHMQAVTRWETYEAKWAEDVRPQPFGSARRRMQKKYDEGGYTIWEQFTSDTRVPTAHFRNCLALDEAVKKWVTDHNTSIPKLLNAPGDHYEKESVGLVTDVMHEVVQAAADPDEGKKQGKDAKGEGEGKQAPKLECSPDAQEGDPMIASLSSDLRSLAT